MKDKLIQINKFLNNKSSFNIPFRTRKLLYYSKEKPKNVGFSVTLTLSLDVKLNNDTLTDEILQEEIKKNKKENITNDEILKRLKDKLKINLNCDKYYPEEPSMIYLSLPISKPINISEIENPSYHPCYARLTPEQKWIYLNWLQDISKPVPKGYVYIYYYGLERQLLKEDNLDAIDELLFLAEHHDLIKKDVYKAIYVLYFRTENTEILKKLFAGNLHYPINNMDLVRLYSLKKSLSSKDIFELVSQYKDVNRRLVNLHPQLYFQELDNYLLDNFDEKGYPFFNYYPLGDLPLEHTNIFLNYSLPEEIRDVELFNIFDYYKFKNDIINIHKIIYQKVRELIKSQKNFPFDN